MESTRLPFKKLVKGDNSKIKQGIATILTNDMSSLLDTYDYQI